MEEGWRPQIDTIRISRQEADHILQYHEKDRPFETDFTDIYGEEQIKSDLLTVESLKEKFSHDLQQAHLTNSEQRAIEDGKVRAEALEATIVGLAEFLWFGPDTVMTRTSEYDDIVNGIDVVVEIEDSEGKTEKPQRIALAIDASTDSRKEVVANKIDRNSKKVLGTWKKTSQVKYFQSRTEFVKNDGGEEVFYRGKLEHVIPVVVGIESSEANAIMSLYVRFLKLKGERNKDERQKKEFTKLRTEIKNHPAQIIFLEEIIEQLRMYGDLLAQPSADKFNLLPQVKELASTFEDILSAKLSGKQVQKPTPILEKDAVHEEIKNFSKKISSATANSLNLISIFP